MYKYTTNVPKPKFGVATWPYFVDIDDSDNAHTVQ